MITRMYVYHRRQPDEQNYRRNTERNKINRNVLHVAVSHY